MPAQNSAVYLHPVNLLIVPFIHQIFIFSPTSGRHYAELWGYSSKLPYQWIFGLLLVFLPYKQYCIEQPALQHASSHT